MTHLPHLHLPHIGGRSHEKKEEEGHRDPKNTQAYLVGGGIASLAAAVELIQAAKVPPGNIHILESLPVPGGSMDGSGNPQEGYILRGGRMLNCSYVCLYDLLDRVPSLDNAEKTVMQEIRDFNAVKENQTHSQARLVAAGEDKPEIFDVKKMGLMTTHRLDLLHVILESEKSLGTKRIQDCFENSFFKTNFWYMWATTFAFQPWHSAVEFRRYLHRFLHEFPRIATLEGVDRTQFNQYDSIVRPIVKYLTDKGVDIRYSSKVDNIKFIEGIPTTVSELHLVQDGTPEVCNVDPNDVVMITIGSMTSGSSVGTNDEPPSQVTEESASDGTWELWSKLVTHDEKFGNPSTFCSRIDQSKWVSFTTTLKDPELLRRIAGFTHNEPGTGALMTLKDSNWLMSIVVPHQPHFRDQPYDVNVFWGYGLFPDKLGNYVQKPMSECSGSEIMVELLSHLHFPIHPILDDSITRPCMMPYITSQFLTREPKDRPKIVPEGSTNLALLGQFVEIPGDTVFTVEYSVRGAQMAVYELMGLDMKPKPMYKGEHSAHVLKEAIKKLMT